MSHDTLYIVDNSNDKASVKNYLTKWCSISKQMDIATGYFEIGDMLTLGKDWRKLDKIRIILGNEVTKRTKDVINDFDEIDDITYDFDADDIGLKEEAFAKISSLRQLQPLCDEQKWGIFCVEFDSNKFEVSALRKILSGLIPNRRNAADHAVWAQKDLLFLCFWGTDNNRTIGIAHFEDKDNDSLCA